MPHQTKLVLPLMVLLLLLVTECSSPASLPVKAEQTGLVNFIRTVQVTPDDQFLTGSFARINYVPPTDHFVVTFGTKASTQPGENLGAGYAFKEYTVEMQETGKTGLLEWYPNASEAGDSGSFMFNNTYYCAFVSQNPSDPYGWRLIKYDAANWTRLNETFVPLPNPNEANTDPMVAYVNGQLDVSDQYNPSGIWQEGNSSIHHFFTADLQPIGMINLADTPHISGSSIVFVDGVYYFVSANSYSGGLVVMKYDADWNYLGMKALMPQAHWSQGMVFDGEYFYVAYLDTSQRTPETFFPVYPNVHLAVFDGNWDVVEDVAVTNFTLSGDKKGGRPWVVLHGNRLYVSYDVDTVNATTQEEEKKWQAYVSIYELAAHKRTRVVPDQYPTIQSAINNANDGDTVFVRSGTYYEHVVVNKTIALVGENIGTTIIDGNYVGVVVNATHDAIGISGFTIQKSGTVWNIGGPPYSAGIYMRNVTDCSVVGNKFTDDAAAIQLEFGADGNVIANNTMTSVGLGWGTFDASMNSFIGNNVTSSGRGLGLNVNSDNNTISGNRITAPEWVVALHACHYNNVTENYIANGQIGIYLPDSSYNRIYHNQIVNNVQQASLQGFPSHTNYWNDDYPSGGNYWSDYVGVDVHSGPNQNMTGSDGIGDTPLVLDQNNTDRYPLMNSQSSLIGDVNGDGKVDMRDVGYVARRFMCVPGDLLWDSTADLNGDGKINMVDIGTVARHFGEHYP